MIARDDGIAAGLGVIHKEYAVALETRVKGKTQQPLLVAGVIDPLADIQKRIGEQLPALEDVDVPWLFDDEESP